MLPLAALFWVILYYLTKCKFRKMRMHDQIEYMPTNAVLASAAESDLPPVMSVMKASSETNMFASSMRSSPSPRDTAASGGDEVLI